MDQEARRPAQSRGGRGGEGRGGRDAGRGGGDRPQRALPAPGSGYPSPDLQQHHAHQAVSAALAGRVLSQQPQQQAVPASGGAGRGTSRRPASAVPTSAGQQYSEYSTQQADQGQQQPRGRASGRGPPMLERTSAPTAPAPHTQHAAPAGSSAAHVSSALLHQVVALQHQSSVRFQDLPVSPLTKQAMAQVFGYELCTHVQAQALPACLTGRDVLAKAKTGTGKTIGFMIPVIEALLARRTRAGMVGALVLSPTRELATQIYQEASKLLTFHRNLSIQVMIGGTNMKSDVSRLRQRVPDVLVATPGRCLDHLTNVESNLAGCVQDLRVLVCDEADNILDMGFRPTIEQILSYLPPPGQRQALLFSATFPQDVKDLAHFALQAPWTVVDTVGVETQTNVQVKQYQQVVPFDDIFNYTYAAVQQHLAENPNDYKVLAFFPTARQTQVMAELFLAAGVNVLEIHSRKSQAHRTRVSDNFRCADRAVMFSSDVSARGVDYPDVSLVLQVGTPSDRAQYVHRVGRTARAGKAGQALLVLSDFEAGFLHKLRDLPISEAPQLPYESRDMAVHAVNQARQRVSCETKAKAYVAFLGFYGSCPAIKLPVAELVQIANRFAKLMGCLEPPELEAYTVGKLGLKGAPGLRIAGRGPPGSGGGGGRRAGGGGGHGRY